jgi:hypothetical protein
LISLQLDVAEAFTAVCSWYLTTQEQAMNTFCEHHQNSIKFGYRCFDRILLNGLIQPFQQPERVIGFFKCLSWRAGDAKPSRRYLPAISELGQEPLPEMGRPILDAPEGRRDDFVDPYFKQAMIDEVVVILKAREPALYQKVADDLDNLLGALARP